MHVWSWALSWSRPGAATLTLHPRSARQMYTGEADHSLTAELVEIVDVPVIASGDITSRARAQSVLARTGAAAVMVGRGAQGNPWALREIVDGDAEEPSREEVAAELILFIRETVRELGRAPRRRVPEEVLRVVSRPRAVPEAVQAGDRPARDDGRSRDASVRSRAGCGRDRRAACVLSCRIRRTRFCSTRCRSPSTAAASSNRIASGSRDAFPQAWCQTPSPFCDVSVTRLRRRERRRGCAATVTPWHAACAWKSRTGSTTSVRAGTTGR